MKKSMKKIAAVLSAAVMCALPMAGSFGTTATAASSRTKTYRTYIDFNKKNSAQANFRVLDLEFFTYNPFKMQSITRGNVGGYISAVHGSGSQYGALHHREWKTGGQPSNGTVLKALTDVSATSTYKFEDNTIFRVKAKKNDGTILSSLNVTENSHSLEHISGCLSIETVLVGDANGDGDVDISDAVMVAQYVDSNMKDLDINLRAADADGNGVVNHTDQVTIQEYLVRLYNFSDIQ